MTRERPWDGSARSYGAAVALVALATAIGELARGQFAAPDFVMVYLLAIVVASTAFGRGPALLACAISVLGYDYFFVPPFHTFRVSDARHLLTFATMFVVGLSINALMSRVRRHEREAIEREHQTAALYLLSRDIASASDEQEVAAATAKRAAETFGGGAAVLLSGSGPEPVARAGTPFLPSGKDAHRVALSAGGDSLGTLALSRRPDEMPDEELKLLHAFSTQAALALERARLATTARAAELRAKTEKMRSSLLSAVSHDLRTPLAAITGAATTLRDSGAEIGSAQRAELADTICEEAERLERFVVNLLEMTKLDAGALDVRREWVPVEELVGAALTRLESKLGGRAIQTQLPADLPLVSVDPVLLEQVLHNLLDNAAKHTPAGTSIRISARAEPGRIVIDVADGGPGIPPGAENQVFEKFFRAAPHAAPGAGLGLAICRGMVEAHGGTLTAKNAPAGGAVFTISLPRSEDAPTVPQEAPPSAQEARSHDR